MERETGRQSKEQECFTYVWGSKQIAKWKNRLGLKSRSSFSLVIWFCRQSLSLSLPHRYDQRGFSESVITSRTWNSFYGLLSGSGCSPRRQSSSRIGGPLDSTNAEKTALKEPTLTPRRLAVMSNSSTFSEDDAPSCPDPSLSSPPAARSPLSGSGQGAGPRWAPPRPRAAPPRPCTAGRPRSGSP